MGRAANIVVHTTSVIERTIKIGHGMVQAVIFRFNHYKTGVPRSGWKHGIVTLSMLQCIFPPTTMQLGVPHHTQLTPPRLVVVTSSTLVPIAWLRLPQPVFVSETRRFGFPPRLAVYPGP